MWILHEFMKGHIHPKKDLATEHMTFTCLSKKENFVIFNIKAPEFYKMFMVHPRFQGHLPY